MSDAEEIHQIDGLVSKFLAAERALKVVLDAAERLVSARDSLAETSSGVYRLTNELKDISRDLGDAVVSLRALSPEKISSRLEQVSQSVDSQLGQFSERFEGTDHAIESVRTRVQRIEVIAVAILVVGIIDGIIALIH